MITSSDVCLFKSWQRPIFRRYSAGFSRAALGYLLLMHVPFQGHTLYGQDTGDTNRFYLHFYNLVITSLVAHPVPVIAVEGLNWKHADWETLVPTGSVRQKCLSIQGHSICVAGCSLLPARHLCTTDAAFSASGDFNRCN